MLPSSCHSVSCGRTFTLPFSTSFAVVVEVLDLGRFGQGAMVVGSQRTATGHGTGGSCVNASTRRQPPNPGRGRRSFLHVQRCLLAQNVSGRTATRQRISRMELSNRSRRRSRHDALWIEDGNICARDGRAPLPRAQRRPREEFLRFQRACWRCQLVGEKEVRIMA